MMSNVLPILYDYWRSSASYRVRITLGLKGIEWEAVEVDLLSGAQKSIEHLVRNPQALVPVLNIDGHSLTQSLAIIEYLEETRPMPVLLPKLPADKAYVRALSYLIAMDVHPVNNLRVLHCLAELSDIEDVKMVWMKHFMANGFEAFEKILNRSNKSEFCFQDLPTLADICMVPQLYNAHRWGVDLSPYPAMMKIYEACNQLPAFKNAHPDMVKPS